MEQSEFWQIVIYLVIIILLVKPLGLYIARIYEKKSLSAVECFIYRLCGVRADQEMGWKTYAASMLFLNGAGVILLYGLGRCQGFLPLNPQNFPSLSPHLAFNVAASFVTNTDWQVYGGETTLSYLTQMLGLTVQNFLSAATGMALLVAFIRGLVRVESNNLGNYWVDMVRGILYILLPLAIIFSAVLVSQGVIQNTHPYQKITLVEAQHTSHQQTITEELIPGGPVASQVAIKQLGSNGGGFFNTNSAHPFENPTPLSNFLEMLAILLIPAALCYTFGVMVNDRRQGWAIFIAMFLIFILSLIAAIHVEQMGNPHLAALGIVGGNLEGKELRFGVANSTLWAIVTTATSNGSVNAAMDSFMPLTNFITLLLMHLGEVVFGGVGCGLYGMLILVIITVFVAGLMVGRTPEYLGKKIEPYEMKMASMAVLLMPLFVLVLTAVGSVTFLGKTAILNSGPHGFSEILYAFTSMGNNNGSSLAGLDVSTPFYTVLGGIEMLILRFWFAIPMLAIAGKMVRKKIIPSSLGTLPTYNLLFVVLLIFVTLIMGALSFFPALALGPLVEHFMLWGYHEH